MSNSKESMFGEKRFTKRVENFTCGVCGADVKGSGYTDHCSSCLWSKHVDIHPGDRKADCEGLMEPLGATQKEDRWRIFYRCQKCDYERFNNAIPDDNFQKIIELSTHPIRPRPRNKE